jgi:hypothetical protein
MYASKMSLWSASEWLKAPYQSRADLSLGAQHRAEDCLLRNQVYLMSLWLYCGLLGFAGPITVTVTDSMHCD